MYSLKSWKHGLGVNITGIFLPEFVVLQVYCGSRGEIILRNFSLGTRALLVSDNRLVLHHLSYCEV